MFRLILALTFLVPTVSFAEIEDFNEILDQAEVDHWEVSEQLEQARKDQAADKKEAKTIRIMDEKGTERELASASAPHKLKKKKHKKHDKLKAKNKNKSAKVAEQSISKKHSKQSKNDQKLKPNKKEKLAKNSKSASKAKIAKKDKHSKKRVPSNHQREGQSKPFKFPRENKTKREQSAVIAAP